MSRHVRRPQDAINEHTILFIQKTTSKHTRTWSDFDTAELALNAIISIFEERLKEMNPAQKQINYDISELNKYIDELGDLGVLVYSPKLQAYRPFDKSWIKQQILIQLKRAAGLM
ncbi:enhancer of rudimentary [Chytridium lagenaria]|nr:enhancer of rudimentary [Chytridium lagenaria]